MALESEFNIKLESRQTTHQIFTHLHIRTWKTNSKNLTQLTIANI